MTPRLNPAHEKPGTLVRTRASPVFEIEWAVPQAAELPTNLVARSHKVIPLLAFGAFFRLFFLPRRSPAQTLLTHTQAFLHRCQPPLLPAALTAPPAQFPQTVSLPVTTTKP